MTTEPGPRAAAGQPPSRTGGLSELLSRLRDEVQENGPRAAFVLLLRGLRARILLVRANLLLDETHIWYEMSTGSDRPRVDLPEDFTFRRAGTDLLRLLKQLPTIGVTEGAQRLAAGHDLWLVLHDERPAFACWTFRRTMPLLGARGDVLVLPAGAAFVENSVTAPEYRGRRLAPAAWTLVADDLSGEGVNWLITKIRDDNVSTQKSVLKSGFSEMARVHHRRFMGRSRMVVSGPAGPNKDYLRDVLS